MDTKDRGIFILRAGLGLGFLFAGLTSSSLVRHGLIEAFVKVYGSLHPSFYGLRTIVVTLFLGGLLRIKRPEHWKEYGPQDLGAILGLDRAPEVKTLRRKFTRLAAMEGGKRLMEELAHRRIAGDEDRVAFLYVDGHVREYHGKFPLFEAKKPQRQVVTPAVTDTWVHDADGEPLLVVTSEANAKLTQVLEPILADVRRLVGDQRRMTVIFDRGGFSPKLFARLIASGFDVITYRKGKIRKLAAAQFAIQRRKIDGVWRQYEVCDRPRVRVGALRAEGKGKGKKAKGRRQYLWMREVRVLRDDGRQTPILTNRQDLSAVMVAWRIFHRWRQENYFKYAEEEFALDALVEYGAEEVSETTDRRNPQWLRLTRRLKEARAEVARLQSELGKEAVANHEATRPTMRGFKIAHAGLREQIQKGEAQIERLLEQRKKTPQENSGHRPDDAEDGEEAHRGCDQDGRLPGGDGTVGYASGPLCPSRRGRPHPASCRLPIARAVGSRRGRIARDHRLPILAASHCRIGGIVRATRRPGPPLPRHPSTPPPGCSGPRTCHIMKRAMSRYLKLLLSKS